MAEESKTYRHRVTGLVQVLSPRVGDANPYLTEVEEGAKPLAYLPIPAEAVEEHVAAKADVPAKATKDKEK